MKEETVRLGQTVKIKQEPEKEAPVFDTSSIELLDEKELVSRYTEHFHKHRDKLLNIVMSRLAFDSAMKSIEDSMGRHMAALPITLRDDESNDKIDAVYDRALVLYAYTSALSEVLTDDEQIKEFIIGFENAYAVEVKKKLERDKTPTVGVSSTNQRERQITDAIEGLSTEMKKRGGLTDEAPSPYGINTKEEPNRKLPVVGTMQKRRRTRNGN